MGAPRKRSLQRQLLLWLLLPQFVLWCAAAFAAYSVALRYTNEVIDHSLAVSSRALARQVRPLGDGLYIDFPSAAREILEEDPNDRLHYMVSTPPGAFILGDKQLPEAPPNPHPLLNHPYFYDGEVRGKTMRIAALYIRIGTSAHPQLLLVQVAKSTALREGLARNILLDTALPLAVLLALTSLMVWMGIRRGLLPLRHLRKLVEDRSPRDMAPLKLENAPPEVHALAKAINTLLNEVQQQVAIQRRFIADAAHQLRTPLAGLKSQTELVHSELAQIQPDHGAIQQRLVQIETSVSRSTRLVNQLLTLARAEPDAPLAHGRADLVSIAREVTIEAVPRALARQLDLGLEDAPDQLFIHCHASLLREMIANLVDNAIQYTPAGGRIDVRVQAEARAACIEVSDNGPGIPESERERVFERFYRGAMEGQGKGCGLGLSIVQEIARRHQAHITLSEAEAGGLCVRIRFPFDIPAT